MVLGARGRNRPARGPCALAPQAVFPKGECGRVSQSAWPNGCWAHWNPENLKHDKLARTATDRGGPAARRAGRTGAATRYRRDEDRHLAWAMSPAGARKMQREAPLNQDDLAFIKDAPADSVGTYRRADRPQTAPLADGLAGYLPTRPTSGRLLRVCFPGWPIGNKIPLMQFIDTRRQRKPLAIPMLANLISASVI